MPGLEQGLFKPPDFETVTLDARPLPTATIKTAWPARAGHHLPLHDAMFAKGVAEYQVDGDGLAWTYDRVCVEAALADVKRFSDPDKAAQPQWRSISCLQNPMISLSSSLLGLLWRTTEELEGALPGASSFLRS